jgi:glycosyltransferase involved in cell wall biosynthesis
MAKIVETGITRVATSKVSYSPNTVTVGTPVATVIIPAFNEEEGLPVVLRNIFAVLDDTYEVIVVDDGSSDRTSEVAADFPCRIIRHEVNLGKGEALKNE